MCQYGILTMEGEKAPLFYNCETCSYICSKKRDWERHTSTRKHKILTQYLQKDTGLHKCECGQIYKHRQSLFSHKKKCFVQIDASFVVAAAATAIVDNSLNKTASTLSNEIVGELLKEICVSNKQNLEFKQMIIEQQTKIIELSNKPTTSNTTITNSNNININMFLNEHCKNAMTIDDFANSIQISIDDIMYMTQKGNREGLTAILTNAFNQLLITERPIHCTDVKRHTTYIKDMSGWNKENDQAHLNKLCRNAEHKCIKKTLDIMKEDPNYTKIGTPQYEHALKMMTEANGGAAGSEYNHNLVVKTLEETVGLDKPLMAGVLP